MWEYEQSLETSAPADALWRCWADITAWPSWNAGAAAVEVDGPFAAGTTFRMTLPDSEVIAMTLTEVTPGRSFTDLMDAGDFQVTTVHRLEPLPGGRTRIVYRTEITGPAADAVGPELGPEITADFPDVLAALAKAAQG
jgi:uncharacterized protein YndB with AHSA1/START domain